MSPLISALLALISPSSQTFLFQKSKCFSAAESCVSLDLQDLGVNSGCLSGRRSHYPFWS